MSDTSKRPGARDISDLKARLGLKKSPPSGGAPAPGNRPIVAPPGARVGNIPAPPGAQPPRAAIPDASHDPFGAMNAMAAHGSVAAQPQIVIVNDGSAVESVEHKRRGIKLAVYGALVIVPLVFGSVLGKIAAQNKAYNSAIADAGKLKTDVDGIGKSLVTVQQTLQLARERGGGRFAVGDEQLIKDLEALTLVEPSFELLTQIQMTQLPAQVAQETIALYRDASALNGAIKDHVRKSKADLKAFRAGQDKAGEFMGKAASGYAAVVSIPSGDAAKANPIASVKLVQLGPPLCDDGKPAEKCPGLPTGFQYRSEESGPWGNAKLATSAGVADAQLVILDTESKVLQGLVQGGAATVAKEAYQARIDAIRILLEGEAGDAGVLGLRKNVETMLQNVANRATKSTFFL